MLVRHFPRRDYEASAILYCFDVGQLEKGNFMRYYISDLHFFHESLNTQMDCRGFKDAVQMNAYMIKQWNSRVRPRDEVVILGDFSVGKAEQTNEILNQLNGRLYMIKGNHDRYLKESEFNKERFVWIKPYAEMHDNRRKVVLSHYPIFCYNGQYRRNKKGEPLTYMLYGHVHDTLDEQLVRQFCQITRQTKKQGKYDEEPCRFPVICSTVFACIQTIYHEP